MRVKMFVKDGLFSLETRINEWLEDQDNTIQIRFVGGLSDRLFIFYEQVRGAIPVEAFNKDDITYIQEDDKPLSFSIF